MGILIMLGLYGKITGTRFGGASNACLCHMGLGSWMAWTDGPASATTALAGMMTSIWRSLMHVNEATAARSLLAAIQQALLDAFRAADGSARALSLEEIAPIKALCDQLTPAHFQLKVPEPMQESNNSARVRYQHIWEDDQFSMGIFILPPGASIPLHDHPDMSVISRVLYGGLHVRSCDLVSDSDAQKLAPHFPSFASEFQQSSESPEPSRHRIARMYQNSKVTAPHTTELLPSRGNLHEFVADPITGCAIFDILTPPYDSDEGRDCSYYRFVVDPKAEKSHTDKENDVVLLEAYDPVDFVVMSEPYHGPRLRGHGN